MPVDRLLPVFLSVLFAAGLWVYGAVSLQTTGIKQDGYATLVCGDAYSDREIRDRLDSQGLNGLISESDQWFFLDSFGYIEKVPLAEYEERLLSFDPRNDGYAEKLKILFVRDGKRFVYIPIGANNQENLDAVIAQALTGISYSFDYASPPPRRDIFLPLIAFSLTVCAFFAIPVLRRRLNAVFLPCLLALSPLALGLVPGFALAALLAGFAALLSESSGRKPPFGRQGESVGLSALQWLLALALIACYVFISFFWELPVLFAFFVLASFCCVLVVSLKAGGGKISIQFNVNKRPLQRRHFTPVEIISRNTVHYSFFPVMLPFAVMAIALALAFAFAGFAMPQPPSLPVMNVSPQPAALPSEGAVTEADFQEHFLFQSAFSFRALGKTYEAGELPVIAAYQLSSNGLLEPAAPDIEEELQIPDFPLGDLLRGISSGASPRVVDEVKRDNSYDWLFAPLPMIFIIPAFVYSRKKGTGRATASPWGVGAGRRRPHADHARESGLQRRKERREERDWGLGR
jgi:hypothetical protein